MTITHEVKMDLMRSGVSPRLDMVQGDSNTRIVEIVLFDNNIPWEVPSGAFVQIRFGKPDGTGGVYDTLPDGTKAWSFDENKISVTIAPQVLSASGNVMLQVVLGNNEKSISTFTIIIYVEKDPSANTIASENYINLWGWMETQISSIVDEIGKSDEFDGATFIPHISESGLLTWTNDKGLPNPEPINLLVPGGVLPVLNGGTGATSADEARANIGAAAAGWGFGEDLYTRSVNTVCAQSPLETYEEFCARIDAELAKMPDSAAKLVVTRGVQSTGQWNHAGFCVAILTKSGQEAHLITISSMTYSATHTPCLWRMHKYGGVWQDDVEWENPPMTVGVEYRTTEIYGTDNPVYTKSISFGSLPNNSAKTMSHGCAATQIVRCSGQIPEDGSAIPRGKNPLGEVSVYADSQVIIVNTDVDMSKKTAFIQLWYTKSQTSMTNLEIDDV